MSRTILITGSSSGIGLSVTRHLLEQNHKVIGISRRAQIESSPLFTHYQIDLSNLKLLPKEMQKILKKHPDIDFLFLNAGYGQLANLEEISYPCIENLISMNLTQTAFLTKAFLPHLKKQSHANLVFNLSTCALAGYHSFSTYCASKFGLRGFAQSIRDECANTKVHVTSLLPGMVRTHFFDQEPLGPSDDSCEAIEPGDFGPIFDLLLQTRTGTVIEEIVLRPQRKGIKKRKSSLKN